jgi:glycosidase
VPNHVAPDHPWLLEHPEYFVRGSAGDLIGDPRAFFEYGGRVFACGRDPYFAPWRDTAQINAFNPALRREYIELLSRIAAACDGVRCDMAMLTINDVFERTWGQRAGTPPHTELWQDVIPAVKAEHPDFLFIAEAYWDREWQLQQFGFDYCYDKRLYDRLVHDNAESVRLHLLADIGYQKKLVRFLENHDESRAAAAFSQPKECAAAVSVLTLPGASLIHEGQLEGRRVKLPIQLRRRPDEPVNTDLLDSYSRLLKFVAEDRIAEGDWQLCERTGWADNTSYLNVLAWCVRNGRRRRLTVVNLSDSPAQARIRVPWDDLGLFVELGAWGYRVLSTRAVPSSRG